MVGGHCRPQKSRWQNSLQLLSSMTPPCTTECVHRCCLYSLFRTSVVSDLLVQSNNSSVFIRKIPKVTHFWQQVSLAATLVECNLLDQSRFDCIYFWRRLLPVCAQVSLPLLLVSGIASRRYIETNKRTTLFRQIPEKSTVDDWNPCSWPRSLWQCHFRTPPSVRMLLFVA